MRDQFLLRHLAHSQNLIATKSLFMKSTIKRIPLRPVVDIYEAMDISGQMPDWIAVKPGGRVVQGILKKLAKREWLISD